MTPSPLYPPQTDREVQRAIVERQRVRIALARAIDDYVRIDGRYVRSLVRIRKYLAWCLEGWE